MADRPILFSGPMVCALLEGRKTQTRRLARDQAVWDRVGDSILSRYPRQKSDVPYSVGDLLWVREAWRTGYDFDATPPRDLRQGFCPIGYEADRDIELSGKLRPGMFMPRWASRLTLNVTDVRVQRLQEISRDDVIAEGITERDGEPIAGVVAGWHEPYAVLWDSLNAKRAPWASNPWIVAVTFTVERENIDRLRTPGASNG